MNEGWIDYSSDYFNVLNLTSADSDVIATLVQAAQTFIERYCHRVFLQQEFDLLVPVQQDSSLILPNPPVDHISHIFMASGQWSSIANTSASVTQASFSTNASSLILSQIVAGVRTDTAFAWASYPTLASLATAIGSYGNGWILDVATGYGTYPTIYTIQNQYGSCINRDYTQMYFWEENLQRNLSVYPNAGIVEGWGGVSWAYPWCPIFGSGLIRYNQMRVIYTAGFPDVPEDVKMVCANLVITAFQGPEGRPQTETIGSYSYTNWRFDQMPMSDQRVLSGYKDRRI